MKLVVAVRIRVSQPPSPVSLEHRPKVRRNARNSRAFCIDSELETGAISTFCHAVSEFSLTGNFVVPSGVPDTRYLFSAGPIEIADLP
jgi:hypothetical protein